MGHSKIYNNDSKYVIANVMDDVENVNVREYLIDFHAKSIYPDRKSTRLNSSHPTTSRMPSSA